MIKLQTSYLGNGCAKIEDVNFSNFSGTNVKYPINMLSGNGAYIKNITMENIRAEGFGMTDLQCDDDGLIDNVTLRNIELRMKDLYDDPLSGSSGSAGPPLPENPWRNQFFAGSG